MRDYFLFSIFRVTNRLSPRRYTNNLFKVRPRNSKALKIFFSAPSAQKVKNFLRASREKEISFLEGGESLEVLVIYLRIF